MSWPAGGVVSFSAGELTSAELNVVVNAFNAMFPIGFSAYLTGYSGTSVETLINGIWLEQNGTAVSRSTYAALNTLYSGVSYPFGSGDGTTTFNLLDLRGRGPLGHPTSSGSTDLKTLGATDGLALASRTPKAAAHTHSVPAHTHAAGSFVVTTNDTGGAGGAVAGFVSSGAVPVTGTSGSGGSGTSGSGGAYTGIYAVGGVWVVKAFA